MAPQSPSSQYAPASEPTIASPARESTSISSANHEQFAGRDTAGIGMRNEQLLASLSGLFGFENDRLVHEICVNSSFRLPDVSVDPYKLPVQWHLKRVKQAVSYTCGGYSISQPVLSIALPIGSDGNEVEALQMSGADIASFKDMPDGSPMAGRITTTISGTSDSTHESLDLAVSSIGTESESTAPTSEVTASITVARTEGILKRLFMDIMGDQMIASMLPSPVISLDDVRCGCICRCLTI